MSRKNIKGITIEIGGDTTKLGKALESSNAEIRTSQKELMEVEKLLKTNQDNTELQRQKQVLLTKSIEETKKKLEILKNANEQAAKSAEKYDAWLEKYTPIQKEIEETKKKLANLRELQAELEENEGPDSDAYLALQKELDETSRRLRDLRKDARAVNEEFDSPISPEQYDALQREIIKTENELENLSKGMDSVENSSQNAGGALGSAKEKLANFCNIAKGGLILEIGEQLEQVGEAAQEAGNYLLDLSAEYENATKKAAAYFGETGAQAEETASIVERVWLDGIGDSMGQVSDAVITVKKNIQDLDSQTIENLTKQALTLDELYGIDMSETLRGVNSLMEQFGLNAQDAMDYIVAGTQNGLDKTNELGDNIAEYAGKFAQAGYSAEEYFQLLQNGLSGGAYNLDKVNDAINEATTRLADGTISDAIGSYSKKTQTLFREWKKGGASQKDVIDSIVSDIQEAETQQEALTLAAAAFGTMAEDGNLNFIESLHSVGSAFEDVTGKANAMYEQTTTPQQELEAVFRELQLALLPVAQQLSQIALQILPPLATTISSLLSYLAGNPTLVNIALAIGAVMAALSAIAPVISTVAALVTAFGTAALGPIIGIIAGVIAAIAAIVAAITNWGSIMQWIHETVTSVMSSLRTMWQNFCNSTSELIGLFVEVVVGFVLNLAERAIALITDLKTKAIELVENIRSKIIEKFENLKAKVIEKVTSLKENAVEKVTAMKEEAIELFENLKQKAEEIIDNLKKGLEEKVELVKETIIDGIDEAVQWIKDLPEQALDWGKDMMDGFIEGIKDKIEELKEVAEDVADSVSDFLHFTRPETGPLRNYEEWMPHMMQGLAEGIRKNRHLITDQIEMLAGDMAFSVNGGIAGGSSGHNGPMVVRVYNQTVLDGQVIAETVNDTLGVVL